MDASSFINGTFEEMNTTTVREASTSIYESREAKAMRRTIYYTMHGIVGLAIVIFNGLVILAYAKREKLRRQLTKVMMNLYIFCFIHGLIVGIVWPLQRVYRYTMGSDLCIITTLVMDFADNYILVLLPVLAIERLLHVKYPNMSKRKMEIWSIVSIITALLVTVCYAWLPLIPDLEIPMARQLSHDNAVRQRELTRFYQHYTCQFRINKKNSLEPIFNLVIGTICVSIVIGVYVSMFCILRSKLSLYSSMDTKKKATLRRAAISVFLVAITFIFTLLPFGITIQIAAFCDSDTTTKKSSTCNYVSLELRFIFSIIAHLGNLLAPLLFTMLNVKVRQSLREFVRCQKDSETNKDNKTMMMSETVVTNAWGSSNKSFNVETN